MNSTKSLRFMDTVEEYSSNIDFDGSVDTDDSHNLSDIPDVNERLAYLRPSRQLLEFYRKRFAQQDGEHETLITQLEDYKAVCDDQYEVEWSLRQREDEITELQKALSEIQLSLFQEREQVLRLYAENDRYKIKDLSSRRIIKKLLEESGQKIEDDNTDDGAPLTTNAGHSTKLHRVPKTDGYKLVIDSPAPGQDEALACEGLMKQIKSLQAKLEGQTSQFRGDIEMKIQERLQLAEQYNYIRERDMDKVKTVTEKLHKTQDLLYMSTQDILSLRKEAKAQERGWMVQKDKLLRELDSVKENLNIDQPERRKKVVLDVSNKAGDSTERQRRELEKIRGELVNAHHLQEMYREQVVSLEDELAKIREQDDLKNDDFSEKTDKIGKRYHILKTRFEDLEKRRNLEVEGFKNDIKMLKKRLKDMQQQLFKVTLGRFDSYLDDTRPDDMDLDVLNNIRKTAVQSYKIKGGLKDMKVKIHNMENMAVV